MVFDRKEAIKSDDGGDCEEESGGPVDLMKEGNDVVLLGFEVLKFLIDVIAKSGTGKRHLDQCVLPLVLHRVVDLAQVVARHQGFELW